MTSLTRTTRTRIAIPLVLAGALALGACENLNATQQRTLSGGAIGAGVGAVATAVTGGLPVLLLHLLRHVADPGADRAADHRAARDAAAGVEKFP